MIVCGDFNSHSQSWGYDHMDKRGEELENWQDDKGLLLLNKPKDPPTYYSRAWQTTSTPDLALYSTDLTWEINRTVGKQLGGSDHRPVLLSIKNELTENACSLPRWNYKKANWGLFKHRSSVLAGQIDMEGKDINAIVKEFNKCIHQAAKEAIPRGARKQYKPYWSEQLELLQEELEKARTEVENNPSQEHHNKHQHAKAKFQRAKLEARRKSWKEKTESLNFEKDGRKLWKLVKQLNDEGTGRSTNITLVQNGKMITGKQAVDNFARIFAQDCNIEISPEKQRTVRSDQQSEMEHAQARISDENSTAEIMDTLLTYSELELAVSKLKLNKSPGIDEISNEMIKNLGTTARRKLLDILNISWTTGKIPQIWRESIMVPLLKPGKDGTTPTSYRPISLTSCLCKTMERIINLRLKFHLESRKFLAPQQAGFRQCYSTEDQTTYLS